MVNFQTLTQRSSFIKNMKQGNFLYAPFFLVQIRSKKSSNNISTFRFGVTASKKVGKSVQRNFAKRRMRSLFREALQQEKAENFLEGYTYDIVLIAKKSLLHSSYKVLLKDFKKCLEKWLKENIKR